MKSREEQLTWAKQRALICVNVGGFADAVAGLRADLAEHPLTKGVMSARVLTSKLAFEDGLASRSVDSSAYGQRRSAATLGSYSRDGCGYDLNEPALGSYTSDAAAAAA
jgi:hypothetical protein